MYSPSQRLTFQKNEKISKIKFRPPMTYSHSEKVEIMNKAVASLTQISSHSIYCILEQAGSIRTLGQQCAWTCSCHRRLSHNVNNGTALQHTNKDSKECNLKLSLGNENNQRESDYGECNEILDRAVKRTCVYKKCPYV